jgi:hypothetical protein
LIILGETEHLGPIGGDEKDLVALVSPDIAQANQAVSAW